MTHFWQKFKKEKKKWASLNDVISWFKADMHNILPAGRPATCASLAAT